VPFERQLLGQEVGDFRFVINGLGRLEDERIFHSELEVYF
jgi:hypothetical protein